MSELIERDSRAAALLAETLARQAAALHIVFMRTVADVLSNKERSMRDVSRALKAQAQCRIALRLLLKLRAVEESQKKSRNRTNKLMKAEIVLYDQQLTNAPAGPDLCSRQPAPPRLDIGHAVKKIANFDERTIERGNLCG